MSSRQQWAGGGAEEGKRTLREASRAWMDSAVLICKAGGVAEE